MKKIITTILAGTLVLSVGAVAAGCDFGGKGSADNKNPSGGTAAQSVYGLGAVTTAKLLMESGVDAKPLAAVVEEPAAPDTSTDPTTPSDPAAPETSTDPSQGETAPDTTPDYQLPESSDPAVDKAQAEAEQFNKYYNMLEGFLEKDATSSVVSVNDSTDPALSGYEFKLVVTGRNELGEANVHTMYYTEKEVAHPDSYDHDHDDDDDEDDDEVEAKSAYQLEGVLAMGTDAEGDPIYYYMSGMRTEESEQDGRESETKSELTIRASATKGDTQNYVLMRHEMESEEEGAESEAETEYTYSIYQNGRLAESTSVSLETENAEAEYEVEYTKNGVRNSYEIERVERGGKVWIEVEYNIDGSRGKFVIERDADGGYTYKFSQNKSDDLHLRGYDD